jgi:hypothetical protein
VGGAENNQRAGGAYMQKLSYQDAFCIDVQPGDENAHGGHRESECQEK